MCVCVRHLKVRLLTWHTYIHVWIHRFCIKMPVLHRLACFRDDVVFLVFLYQVSVRSRDNCIMLAIRIDLNIRNGSDVEDER